MENVNGYILAEIKGEIAERKVKEGLEELEREGLIEKFGQTFRFSKEDFEGIDFVIISKKRKEIRLQVKASFNEKAMKKYLKRGIFYIAVPPGQEKDEVKQRILKIIEIATKRQKSDNR